MRNPAWSQNQLALVVTVMACACMMLGYVSPAQAQAAGKKPNILVIWGDDIGWYNPSIYHRGDMGYWTPEHRPDRQGRRDVHELVRPAELHRRTSRVHHRTITRSAPG